MQDFNTIISYNVILENCYNVLPEIENTPLEGALAKLLG
jgi:hypothetical protein